MTHHECKGVPARLMETMKLWTGRTVAYRSKPASVPTLERRSFSSVSALKKTVNVPEPRSDGLFRSTALEGPRYLLRKEKGGGPVDAPG
jgi:hypothetical protein